MAAKKKPKPKRCDCAGKVTEQLNSQGAELKVSYSLMTGLVRTYVVTEKVDPRSRTKLVPLLATFCPFCGEKYQLSNGPSVST